MKGVSRTVRTFEFGDDVYIVSLGFGGTFRLSSKIDNKETEHAGFEFSAEF